MSYDLEGLVSWVQAQLLSYVNLQCDAPTLATAASDALFPPDEESDSSLNGSWDANGLLESLGSTPCTSLSRDLGGVQQPCDLHLRAGSTVEPQVLCLTRLVLLQP